MAKYLVIVSYDGSGFFGFQKQKGLRTVQEEIEKALKVIHKSEVKIVGSGRTDAKVHALSQCFMFISTLKLEVNQWRMALKSLLPEDIVIQDVKLVNDDFHVRYDVVKKNYFYKINTDVYNVFERNYVYQYNDKLDIDLMKQASKYFIGKHDFRNFCKNSEEEVKDFERIIYDIDLFEIKKEIYIYFSGNGFLRYMVRTIVGALIEIGSKRKDLGIITSRLDNKENDHCPYVAPPEGLYLDCVEFKEDNE